MNMSGNPGIVYLPLEVNRLALWQSMQPADDLLWNAC